MTANTSRGYPYPLSTDTFRPHEHMQDMAEAIDDDVSGLLGGWTAFTPTFGASAGSPALGNGTIGGRYKRLGKTVTFTAKMTWGSTTNSGTGFLRFGLPSARISTVDFLGDAMLLDSSAGTAGYVTATCLAGGTDNFVLIGAAAGGFVTNTIPFTFGAGDIVRWGGTYEEP